MSGPVTAFLGLGANVGDRLETLTSCLFVLDESDGVAVEDVSGVYETAPWGVEDQDPFLNAVVRVRTTLSPRELLAECHLTEAAFGRDRDREQRWGPRTLDIDEVQRRMPAAGMNPKEVIEGPPCRACPILLRQTSFKALEEPIRFAGDRQGTHTARFGEIEQRGVALTAKGRALYDRLLGESRRRTAGLSNEAHQRVLAEVFADFPDTEAELRRQGLAFFEYRTTEAGREAGAIAETEVERLIEQGLITARPITYEDFLPVSAAGIFQSNLGGDGSEAYAGHANREAFEEALGAPVTDELTLYAERERSSLDAALTSLGIPPVR